MTEPLIDQIAAIIRQGSDDHEATAESVISAMISTAKTAFIPNTARWLEQVKAGKEFRM